MSERPFRVLGVQQIAIGGPDRAALGHLWIDLFGLTPKGTYRSERENVDELIAMCGDVAIDLMQPIDPEKKPRVDVPPLNHVGLWVDDLRAAVAWLEAQGLVFAPGGIRRGAAGHDVTFVHPKSACGVLVELVQAPEGLGGTRLAESLPESSPDSP